MLESDKLSYLNQQTDTFFDSSLSQLNDKPQLQKS